MAASVCRPHCRLLLQKRHRSSSTCFAAGNNQDLKKKVLRNKQFLGYNKGKKEMLCTTTKQHGLTLRWNRDKLRYFLIRKHQLPSLQIIAFTVNSMRKKERSKTESRRPTHSDPTNNVGKGLHLVHSENRFSHLIIVAKAFQLYWKVMLFLLAQSYLETGGKQSAKKKESTVFLVFFILSNTSLKTKLFGAAVHAHHCYQN